MTRRLVVEGWNSYRREVLPQECGPVQLEETRRAFYAGAAHLFYALQSVLDADAEPTDADLAQMQAIEVELVQYVRGLKP